MADDDSEGEVYESRYKEENSCCWFCCCCGCLPIISLIKAFLNLIPVTFIIFGYTFISQTINFPCMIYYGWKSFCLTSKFGPNLKILLFIFVPFPFVAVYFIIVFASFLAGGIIAIYLAFKRTF